MLQVGRFEDAIFSKRMRLLQRCATPGGRAAEVGREGGERDQGNCAVTSIGDCCEAAAAAANLVPLLGAAVGSSGVATAVVLLVVCWLGWHSAVDHHTGPLEAANNKQANQ